MARSESAPSTASPRDSLPRAIEVRSNVVWMRGDHDIATRVPLVVAIARAAQRDEGDLLLDLSEVTFMDASTVGALVASRDRLGARSQSLLVRAPSAPARRVLELCGLADIIQTVASGATHPIGAAAALGTWVDVAASTPPFREGGPPSEDRLPARSRRATGARLALKRATLEVDRRGP